MTRTYLITGATGFVGRKLLPALATTSNKIRVVVRRSQPNIIGLGDSIEKIIPTNDIFSESDQYLDSICKGVDTVIHLAWNVDPGNYLQSRDNNKCLIGTIRLAEACARVGVRRFVGVGTCFEYDLSVGVLSVHSPLKPATLYAAAKLSSFFMLTQIFLSAKIEFAWARLFYLYGDGEKGGRLVPHIRSKIVRGEPVELTSGDQIRDYLNVTHAARELADLCSSQIVGPVNICSGIPITVRQMAEEVADEYGRRDLLRFGAREDNLIDPPCVVGLKRQL